jgi:hypothetical protein
VAVPSASRRFSPISPSTALSAIAGLVFGLALARALYESGPLWLTTSGGWPITVPLAVLGAVAGGGLSLNLRRSGAEWAPLALALPLPALLALDVNPLRSTILLVGALTLTGLLGIGRPNPLPDGAFRDLRPAPCPEWEGGASVPEAPFRLPDWFYLALLFVISFLLYLRTLAPAVGEADTFEFQVGVARLGIAHGSGYPLLMLLGKFFSLLPVGGTLAFRANLTSAFFASLAAIGVERLARRLGVSPLIAFLATLAFGLSPTLWSRATAIEAYTLNAFFVAIILNLCLSLLAPRRMFANRGPSKGHPLPAGEGRGEGELSASSSPRSTANALGPHKFARTTYWLCALFGLSLTNHLTTIILVPACLVAVAWGAAQHQFKPRQLVRMAGVGLLLLLLGLSLYLYLPIRWRAVNNGELLSLSRFTDILSGGEAKGAFDWQLPLREPGRFAIVAQKIVGEYGWPGIGLALIGAAALVVQARRSRSAPTATRIWPLIVIVLAYLGYVYFAAAFNVPDPDFSAFFIPLHLIAAVLMGAGAQWLIEQACKEPRAAPALATGLAAAFALLPLSLAWRGLPLVDQSQDWALQRLGDLMLSEPLALNAVILADSQKIAPLVYLQVAEGRRPDLDIIVLPDEASYRAALDERLAAGQTVYLGRYLPNLGGSYSLRSVGPLAEVSTVPITLPQLVLRPPLSATVAPAPTLVGYAQILVQDRLYVAAPWELDITLAWRSQDVAAISLLVHLRLVGPEGHVAWQGAGSVPVGGLYPTNAWRAGEAVTDFHHLVIDGTVPPGSYTLEVALLRPFDLSEAGWSAVAPVSIPAGEAPPPANPRRAQIDGHWLLGYDAPESVAPGSRFPVTLYWAVPPEAQDVTVLGETRSLAVWPAGQVAPLGYQLTAPLHGDAFILTLGAGPARCGWLAPVTAGCALPAIRLAGQAAVEGAYNFDGQLLLTRAELQTPSAAPGGTVDVRLNWQALRAMADDYTVFVHLLGPDGQVHGQVDAWPVSGTRATSTWSSGESIDDPYTIRIPSDAPAGNYQVEIGLYLLSTGQRLPLLNAEGSPISDHVLLPGPRITP